MCVMVRNVIHSVIHSWSTLASIALLIETKRYVSGDVLPRAYDIQQTTSATSLGISSALSAFAPDFPASSPWVTSVGATQVHLSHTLIHTNEYNI